MQGLVLYRWFSVASFAALTFLQGCGGEDEWAARRPKVYAASGTVKLDGKPLDGATVIYHSQSHDVSAQGLTDAQGNFKLTTFKQNDGATEGSHKVVVTKFTYEEKKTKFDSPNEKSVALIPKEVLPKRYATPTTTPIEVQVKTSGSNNAVIELQSK